MRKDWVECKLFEVCDKAKKVKKKEIILSDSFIYIDIGGIDNQKNIIKNHKEYKWASAPSRAQQITKVGDVLFSTVRTYLKNIARVTNTKYEDQICSSGFTVIRGNKEFLTSKYIFYITIHEGFLKPLNELQTGTSYPAVRDDDIFKQKIPIPPLPEQRAIADKIDQLFSKLDNAVANLKEAKEKLKVYRQAVLKKAFEGELLSQQKLEECRQEPDWKPASDLLKEINPSSRINVNDTMREDWIQITILDIAKEMKRGPFGSNLKKEFFVPNGYKVYEQQHAIKKDYTLGTYYISEKKYLELEGFSVRSNDYIISCSGTIGKLYRLPEEAPDGIINQALLKFTLEDKLLIHSYFYYLFQSKFFQMKILTDTRGTGIQNLAGIKEIKAVPILIPPLPEQRAIVQVIETRLSVADKMAESIDQSLEKAQALRQSILKKAFEGKLLSAAELEACRKEADWEPAEKLLERIRLEREADKKAKSMSSTDKQAAIICMLITSHEKEPKYLAGLGRVKCEKMVHLAEYHVGIDLERNPVKDAAGPNDFAKLNKAEARAKKANFFQTRKQGNAYSYSLGRQADSLIEKFRKSISEEQLQSLNKLINDFLPFDKKTSEIPATLYAAWNNLLIDGITPTDDQIIFEARENWSQEKLRIPKKRFYDALKWMRDKGYVPIGRGKKVKEKGK